MKKILLFTLLLSSSLLSIAQWSSNPAVNTPVFTGSGDQFYSGSAADGSGGVIIAWQSETEVNPGASPQVYHTAAYVQKLSAAGIKQWNVNGVKLSAQADSTSSTYIISDGSGGVIAAWQEDDGNSVKIYAQRIDAAGNRQWGNNGIVISTAAGKKSMGMIYPDGTGGAVITWTDEALFGNAKIYAQRVNNSGAVQWTSGGVLVSDNIGFNSAQFIYSDLAGGYVIIWEEETEEDDKNFEGTKIYWQKLNSNGTRQTPSNTLIFNFLPSNTAYTGPIGAVPDGSGGIYVALSAENDGNAALYLQHVLLNGTKAFGPDDKGMQIDASIGSLISQDTYTYVNYAATLASDNAGGAILGWSDTRSAKRGFFAQRVTAAGTKLWGANDLTLISEMVSPASLVNIVTNHEGSFVFNISKGSVNYEETQLYAQKVSPSGTVLYAAEGVAVATSPGFKFGEMVASSDKVIFVWSDSRAGGNGTMTDIYAQSVFTSGVLPVHFLDFTAAYLNGSSVLTWLTASESNNSYFVAEKSENGSDFSSIGSIKGAGNSSQANAYTYTDPKAASASGSIYYRIKQVDHDGKYSYSEIKAVKVPSLLAAPAISYFPNPVKEKLKVDFNKAVNTRFSYSLADASGKVLLRSGNTAASGSFAINMEHLPAGIYLLNIETEGKSYKNKIVKD